MATGLPKTKWNGKNKKDTATGVFKKKSEVFLSYSDVDKLSEEEVLGAEGSQCSLLWPKAHVWKKSPKNCLYCGDNFPILSALAHDVDIIGKVRLVYIDPPYATQSVFQSRSQVDAYTDLLFGAEYIEFIRRRLIFLRELLAEDGSIYVHLDSNMVFHVKVILDEIFGRNNFRNLITRKKCNTKNYTRKNYGDISDFILFYTKSDKYVWNRPYDGWTEVKVRKEYTYVEENTGRRYKKVPIHAPGVRNGETGKQWRGMKPPPGKHWQFTPSKLDEMEARGEIYWSPTGNPRRKVYFDQSKGIPVQNIWPDYLDAHNQNIKITGYPTEKNPDMIQRIILASSNPGDLVLDCFSGSGATLAVAENNGRRWIGIDNSPEAITSTIRRFVLGCEKMGDYVNGQSKRVSPEPQLLFDDIEDNLSFDFPIDSHKLLSAFGLYVAEPVGDTVSALIPEWVELLKRLDGKGSD